MRDVEEEGAVKVIPKWKATSITEVVNEPEPEEEELEVRDGTATTAVIVTSQPVVYISSCIHLQLPTEQPAADDAPVEEPETEQAPAEGDEAQGSTTQLASASQGELAEGAEQAMDTAGGEEPAAEEQAPAGDEQQPDAAPEAAEEGDGEAEE